jgi:Arc/MetJ family transcription regulator
MRTNIEIDDKLMKEAMRCANTKTKQETVRAALRMLILTHNQAGIRKLRGKVKWEGNLDELRSASTTPGYQIPGKRR